MRDPFARLPLAIGNAFYTVFREERQFVAMLAHLLMITGVGRRSNLQRFLDMTNQHLTRRGLPPYEPDARDLTETQVYIEFAYLRDDWYAMGTDNVAKRALIIELIRRVPSLSALAPDKLPSEIAEFNACFLGVAGLRGGREIASPAQWKVPALYERWGSNPQVFRDLCKLSWSFRIRPDLVVVLPGAPPLCVEAKLESGESQYPSGADARYFDALFPRGDQRVRQVELQGFLFEYLIGAPCRQIAIARKDSISSDVPVVTWTEIFRNLDTGQSLPFVGKFIAQGFHSVSAQAANGKTSAPTSRAHDDIVSFERLVQMLEEFAEHVDVHLPKGREGLQTMSREAVWGQRWKVRVRTGRTVEPVSRLWISGIDMRRWLERW